MNTLSELLRCSGWVLGGVEPHLAPRMDFPIARGTKRGVHHKCRNCMKLQNARNNKNRNKGGPWEASHRRAATARYHRELNLPFDPTVTREGVYERDNGQCHICLIDVDPDKYTTDHRIPVAKKGGWTWDNIFTAHPECNLAKGACTMEELEERGILDKLRGLDNAA